ncbi:sporulation protein YpjB [Domibacillus sp. A3M-37]|uniref:sporulation protein YpjB n=1 Tax=Domibacillus TaxID=1433999 RepID=UPI000617A9A0|nr:MULTISPECIES: sporulation protein YpjB [Domibacillus]MCP3763183.1 sporulation protein YpjB [Domibacillus sp. A3M-37]
MEKIIAFIWSFLLIFVPVSGAEGLDPEKNEQLIHVTALTGSVIIISLLYTGRKKYKGMQKKRDRERNL